MAPRTEECNLDETSKRLPQDIANLLAHCIRDLIWYKPAVISFFEECGVPRSIILQVKQNQSAPTLKLVPLVLDQLYAKGDEGFQIAKTMLTKIYYWKDIHSVPEDRKDRAIAGLKALQNAYRMYTAQEIYERERKAQLEREERLRLSTLDHIKLQEFRDRFDRIYFLEPVERGNSYEELLNDIFSYYFPDAFDAFNRRGEQVDGQFYFDGHWYFVEIRWRKDPASAADISVLRDRARQGFAGDVRAVFISFNDFSQDCLNSLEAGTERVILLTGYDFRSVLECDIALDVLLHRIQAYLIKNKVTYVEANRVINM
jgi:hypothetical protein